MSGEPVPERTQGLPPAVWPRIASAALAAAIPVVLALTNVRLLMSRAYLEVEYRLPGFPQDRYGFSMEDRLHWAPIALDYLLNDEGTDFLADLRFEDGNAVYNARELRHMDDVKRLTQAALRVWWVSLAVAGGSILALIASGRRRALWEGLRRGSGITLAVMLLLVLGLAAAFSFVFVGFHRIFFEGNSWLFLYTDTLIRLFPERFWRDAFALIALSTLTEAVLTYVVSRRQERRARAGLVP